jgi:hypothetical protein
MLPVLFWGGESLDNGLDDKIDAITDLELNTPDEGLLTKALRGNMCPNCVVRIILIDTLFVSINSRVLM